MFIFTWYDKKVFQVVGDQETVLKLAETFEQAKKEFKISDRMGYISQHAFGFGHFDYWLTGVRHRHEDDTYTKEQMF